MVLNSDFDRKKSNVSIGSKLNWDGKSTTSTTTLSKSIEDAARRSRSLSASEFLKPKSVRIRSKTVDGKDIHTNSSRVLKKPTNKSETNLSKKIKEEDGTTNSFKSVNSQKSENSGFCADLEEQSLTSKASDCHGRKTVQKNISESLSLSSEGGTRRVKVECPVKKMEDIPKLTPISKAATSKVRIQTGKDDEKSTGGSETRSIDTGSITSRETKGRSKSGKRESSLEEKIQEALKNPFTTLIPLYQKELEKISNKWVNTAYCSLTLRANLCKLLFETYPQINKSQFQLEGEKIVKNIEQVRSCLKNESDTLIDYIRTLLLNYNKTKEQCSYMMTNIKIAESYNYDWSKLNRKIVDTGEEIRQLQLRLSENQRKVRSDTYRSENFHNIKAELANKEIELQKLSNQLQLLKQKESYYKENVFMKVQDYEEIKEEIRMLIHMKKEFKEMEEKFSYQNEMYQNTIRDLEGLLFEKESILEKEKKIKNKMKKFLMQKTRLSMAIGKEQVDFMLKGPAQNKNQRRDELWLAAVKLVLRGFFVQMKKLERDKNKLLLELRASDPDSLNELAATIVRKENFIKSIKSQMISFQKVSENLSGNKSENESNEKKEEKVTAQE